MKNFIRLEKFTEQNQLISLVRLLHFPLNFDDFSKQFLGLYKHEDRQAKYLSI